MPIIILDKVKIPDGSEIVVKRYISEKSPLTNDLKQQAEKNDGIIEAKMREIEQEMKREGYIQLKGKKGGVIQLWYEVGTRLAFVDSLELDTISRKFVWRAIFDHAGALYDHTESMSIRARERPLNSHFRYCYLIGKKPWSLVKSAGNWTAWVEFFDSIAIREDDRIVYWIDKIHEKIPNTPNWLRILNKAIRNDLRNLDTSVLSETELISRLDRVFERTFLAQ